MLRNVPIRRKLSIIVMVATCAALLVAALASAAYEIVSYRQSMVRSLSTIALMIGENSSAALTFNDPVSARQTLLSLGSYPHIRGAALYDSYGHVFATYASSARAHPFRPPALQADGYRFIDDRFELFRTMTVAGESAGAVYIESDLAEIYAGLRRFAWIAVLTITLAFGVGYLLSARLQAAVSGQISHLAEVVGIVATKQDYSVRASKGGQDELGRLIDGFNDMLSRIQAQDAELQDARDTLERRVAERTRELQEEALERQQAQSELIRTHEQLMEASRFAGMAEIATNVLHDVGNVLNSVNVSASIVADSVMHGKMDALGRLSTLLEQHRNDFVHYVSQDERGRHLPEYLRTLVETLIQECRSSVAELELLRKNVDHIKDIVVMQQAYARVGGVESSANLNELVEDSLRLNAAALNRRGVEPVRDLAIIGPLTIDKHKVLQVLVNLLRNANAACEESGRAEKRVTVRTRRRAGHVEISVIDNGVGITPENLSRIFQHGFTTRATGHGFGLHGAALAARDLGGSLSAHSDGVGCGATFTLRLPYVPSAARSELRPVG